MNINISVYHTLIIHIGSSPSLFPIDPRLFFYDDSKNFIYLRGEFSSTNQNSLFIADKGAYNPVDQLQMLHLAGAVVRIQDKKNLFLDS